MLCCNNIRDSRAEIRKGGLWKIRGVGRLVGYAALGATEEGRATWTSLILVIPLDFFM